MRQHSGLDVAFGGIIRNQADGFVINSTAGERTQPLDDLDIHTGRGLGGKALLMTRPVSVADYHRAEGITHQYDQAVASAGLRSIFAIPVISANVPRAMLYGAIRNPTPISDVQLSWAHRAVRRFEFDLRVDDEVARRIAALEAEASVIRMREQLRDVYAETEAIAAQVSDPALKTRIEALAARLRPDTVAHAGDGTTPSAKLTKRERDVIVQVAAGCTNAEAARQLNLELSTVKAYMKAAMRKCGARNRVALVATCRQDGLIA